MVTLLPDLLLTLALSSMLVVAGLASVAALPWRAEELRATEVALRGVAGHLRVRLVLALAGGASRPVRPEPDATPWPARIAA